MNKFDMYEQSVQCPEFEIDFVNMVYHQLRGKRPLVLREDFCGTGMLSCEWVKQSEAHSAIAIDLCGDTMQFGKNIHFAGMTSDQQSRVKYMKRNVLHAQELHADVAVALNFSYWVFRKRSEMLAYFKAAHEALKNNGLFVLDMMGGAEIVEKQTDVHRQNGFTYYWECESFNPITNECNYAIHFKVPNKPKIKRAFTYEWRMWSIVELRELLEEAGFRKSYVYWEEEDAKGNDTGTFSSVDNARNDPVWLAYIVAVP